MTMQDEVPDDEIIKDEKLPEDHDTPFSEPDDIKQSLPSDDPALDSADDIDDDEQYQEGTQEAAEQDDGTDRKLEHGDQVG